MSLVVQTLVLATAITLIIGVAIYRSPLGAAVGNSVTAIGLTIPSYALLGVLVGIVGLNGVDKALVESARGMGMSRFATLIRLELPLAWPVIMTGVRISAHMLMGIAAIAAYALGPGLGGYIFSGISRMGGAGLFPHLTVGDNIAIVPRLLK